MPHCVKSFLKLSCLQYYKCKTRAVNACLSKIISCNVISVNKFRRNIFDHVVMTLTSDVHSSFDGVLLTSASKDLSRHVIVVTFILRSRQTNIEIDLRQANGAGMLTKLIVKRN